MAIEQISYFGREHFLDIGNKKSSLTVARISFYKLVGRVVFPNVRKLPDFRTLGLEIKTRQEAGIGDVPDIARYARSPIGKPVDAAFECENYVIGRISLGNILESQATEKDNKKRVMSEGMMSFCNQLIIYSQNQDQLKNI